jgi:hypothetical protein
MGHSGKRIFLKKIEFLPRVLHSGKIDFFLKKDKFLPRVQHSGKSFFEKKQKPTDGTDGVKSSPSARTTLGEGFPECPSISRDRGSNRLFLLGYLFGSVYECTKSVKNFSINFYTI